ncbi:MAG: hypothetical protein ACLFUI_10350 [Halanaerobiales bacterium]
MRRQKKIIIVLIIILLLSFWYLYNNYELYGENILSVSANNGTSSQMIEQLNDFSERYLAGDSSVGKSNPGEDLAPSLEDTATINANLPAGYKEIISNKNIFALIEIKPEVQTQLNSQDEGQDESQNSNIEADIVLEEDNPLEDDGQNDPQTIPYEEEESIIDMDLQFDDRFNNTNRVEPVPNPFYLQGVSLKENDRMAIVLNQNTYQSHLIRVGQTIDGYLVKSIDQNSVIMEKTEQEIIVYFQGENEIR